jgi:signal transduction histidine kinase
MPPGGPPGPVARRLVAIPYLATFPLTVLFFSLSVAAIPTVIVTVGLALLAIAIPGTRVVANWHRTLARYSLGEPIERPYRPAMGDTWLRKLQSVARDPQSWRDLLWLFVSMIVGFTLALLSVTLLLAALWDLVYPLVFAVTPRGVFDMNYGIWTSDTVSESFHTWVFAAILGAMWWYLSPYLNQAIALIDKSLLGPTQDARVRLLETRVQVLADTRSEAVDVNAAELRRIERDLHDGAQARLVSTGMTLGMALDALDTDPVAARAMLEEARTRTGEAIHDLRSVVRGIHPPVLSDRGLVGAVEALAIDLPLAIKVSSTLRGRPPQPVESAMYFAVSECLTNVGKHAGATQGWVVLSHDGQTLHAQVEDDGAGGASVEAGGGLEGISRRLAVFDGTVSVTSPTGGPTKVAMEVPCVLSSQKT